MDCTISTANDKLHAYSTYDTVEGVVNLTFQRNTTIEQLRISFLGKASVCLKDGQQNPTTAQYIQGEQTFLSMEQPIDLKDLPSNGIALRRRTYRLPFEFVIPETLLPHACSCHLLQDEQPCNDHLPLPPTLDSRRRGGLFLNGTHSNQGQIYYIVQVTFRMRFSDGTSRTIREERKINVRPIRRNPNTISAPEADKCKPIGSQQRFGDLDGNVGELEAYANQPLILRTSPCSSQSTPNTSLSAPLILVFQQSHPGERPPIVEKVSIKLLCTTFFSAVERSSGHGQSIRNKIETSHTETKRLRPIKLAGLGWTKQPSTTPPSMRARETLYFTTLQLPINIHSDPKVDRAEMPLSSFNTCSISRSYEMQFSVSYRTAPHQPEESDSRSVHALRRLLLARRRHLTLRAPLQIYCVDDKPVRKWRGYSRTLLPEDVVEDKLLESDIHDIEELGFPQAYYSVVC